MTLLPMRQRILDVLKRGADQALPTASVAARAGCSPRAVKVHIHYIRAALPRGCKIVCDGWGKGYRFEARAA